MKTYNTTSEYITELSTIGNYAIELADGFTFIDDSLDAIVEQLTTYNEWELERLESFQGILDDFDSSVHYEDGMYNAETSDGFYLEEVSVEELKDAIENYMSDSKSRCENIADILEDVIIAPSIQDVEVLITDYLGSTSPEEQEALREYDVAYECALDFETPTGLSTHDVAVMIQATVETSAAENAPFLNKSIREYAVSILEDCVQNAKEGFRDCDGIEQVEESLEVQGLSATDEEIQEAVDAAYYTPGKEVNKVSQHAKSLMQDAIDNAEESFRDCDGEDMVREMFPEASDTEINAALDSAYYAIK